MKKSLILVCIFVGITTGILLPFNRLVADRWLVDNLNEVAEKYYIESIQSDRSSYAYYNYEALMTHILSEDIQRGNRYVRMKNWLNSYWFIKAMREDYYGYETFLTDDEIEWFVKQYDKVRKNYE